MAEDKNKAENTKEPVAIGDVIKEKGVEVEKENTKNTKQTSGSNSTPENPYSEIEFEEFLKMIGEANLSNWSIMAEALGVDITTITRWKRTPQARQAIKSAIAENLQQMEIAGKGDWKMHREKLKMLGVNEKQVIENRNDDISDSLQDIAKALQGIYEQEDSNGNTNKTTDSDKPEKDTGDSATGK